MKFLSNEEGFETVQSIEALLQTGKGRSGKPLSQEQRQLVRSLRNAFGLKNAVSLADLLVRMGWQSTEEKQREARKRQVKGLVEELRNEHLVDVGASRAARQYKQTGYYWITTSEEFQETWGPFYSQCLTGLETYRRALRRHGGQHRMIAEEYGQLPLFERRA